MALFAWEGIDAHGQLIRAYSLVTSRRQLLLDLRTQSITPTLLRRCWQVNANAIKRQLLQLLDQLAWLLQAHIPLATALQQLPLTAKHAAVRSFALQLQQRVTAGHALSEALRCLAAWLSPEYLAFIAAGESSGRLAEMLSEVTRQQRQQQQLMQRIRQALRYPLIILLSTLLMFVAMLCWVIPHYTNFLTELHTPLPPLTRSILGLTTLLKPLAVGLLLLGSGFFWLNLLRRRHLSLQLRWHTFLLRLPSIGKFVQLCQLYRWCYLMAAGTQTQLPLLDCLQLAQRSLSNHALQHRFAQATQLVLQGRALHQSLQSCRAFTRYDLTLIMIGEQTATLAQVFDCMSRHYQQHLLQRLQTLTAWLEPLLLLGLGGITALLIVAFYQPMIHLGLHL